MAKRSGTSEVEQKDDFGLEVLRGRVTLAVEALKLLALINGGAAVAVLTYLGQLVKDGAPRVALAGTRYALLAFSAGLLSAVLAFMMAYYAQAQLHAEHIDRNDDPPPEQRHPRFVIATFVLAIVSAACFAAGAGIGAFTLTTPRLAAG